MENLMMTRLTNLDFLRFWQEKEVALNSCLECGSGQGAEVYARLNSLYLAVLP